MGIGFETYKNFIKKILRRVQETFDQENILSFVVFGSVARGQATPQADIDLLIAHKKLKFSAVDKFVKVLLELKKDSSYQNLKERGFSPDPYPLFMTEEELWEKPYILLDILDEGIILYDTGVLENRLKFLRKRLQELGAKKIPYKDSWYWDLKPDWKPGEVIKL